MPTPPTSPTYWWLTVRIDACRTRDERVAAASGDDAVRMWRELHPNLEVIHVRPVPEPERFAPKSIEERIAEADAAVEASMKRIRKIIATPARQLAAEANRSAVPVADGPAVPEGREPASVVSEPSDEELLELMPEGFTAPVCAAAAIQANVLSFARAVLARFGHHSPDATKMVGHAEGDVAELVAWLRGANWDSKRQTLATRAADLLEQRHPAPPAEGDDVGDEARYWVKELRDQADELSPSIELFGLIHRAADLLEQRHPAPVPVSERLPGAAQVWFEFVVSDADYCPQARGTAPTYAQALSEGQHYLAQYQQDGPHTLELRRVEVLNPDALPLPQGEVK